MVGEFLGREEFHTADALSANAAMCTAETTAEFLTPAVGLWNFSILLTTSLDPSKLLAAASNGGISASGGYGRMYSDCAVN